MTASSHPAFRRFFFGLCLFILPTILLCSFEFLNRTVVPAALASIPENGLWQAIDKHALASMRERVIRHPSRLRKLHEGQIISLFNAPDLEQEEGDYRHWQYISARCVLNLYLKKGGTMKELSRPVVHVDFQLRRKASITPKEAGPGHVDKQECLMSLAVRHASD